MNEKKTLSFLECIDEAEKVARLNATVRALCSMRLHSLEISSSVSEHFEALGSAYGMADGGQNSSISALLAEKLNAKKFILLLKSMTQSNLAVALYAGDGIIVKVTEKSYHDAKIRPYGLPPICTYDAGNFKIGCFPWVNMTGIGPADVDTMKTLLAKNNLQFKKGDARPENIGKLPDGTLVVLDGNAVEAIDRSLGDDGINPQQLKEWWKRIKKNFGALYDNPAALRLRDNPDFTFHFYPLINRHQGDLLSRSSADTVKSRWF